MLDGQAKRRPQLPRPNKSDEPTPGRLVGCRPSRVEQIATISASRV